MRFFEIKKNKFKKNYYFLGLKVGSRTNHKKRFLNKTKQLIDEALSQHDINRSLISNREIMQCLTVFNLHQKTFTPFKNIHQGKDVVLVATGPSLNDYVPIDNAIHVGVNKAFMCDKIKLDYLFMLDYLNVRPYIAAANEYRRGECVKFYGLFSELNHGMHIPDIEADRAGALRYYISDSGFSVDEQFNYNIDTQTLACFWSVIFQAAQFALYTNPRRIYLVGCDCSFYGHFDSNKPIFSSNEALEQHRIRNFDGWNKFKNFAALYYPETEIISINPVGLKGMFKDMYTTGEN